jgi:lipoprotein-anchoring transpeptidase ErfK/SrfK
MRKIVVDLRAQTVAAYEGGTLFHACECVTGDAAHPTPVGRYKVLRREHPYTSHTYNVPMNYALFFKGTGEALHQYHGPAPWGLLRIGRTLTSAVGSHGCVRLQESDARKLYHWARVGTTVEIRELTAESLPSVVEY